MLKKILFTALVIFLVYLVVRWRQKKSVQVALNQPQQKTSFAIYYLAGSVVTVMIASIMAWAYFTMK
jgi:hypothetical protein